MINVYFCRFFKVGNNPKENKTSDSSWRQTILNKVRDPSKESEFDSTMKLLPAVLKSNIPFFISSSS